MATDWAPVIQTAIGAAAAIGGGIVGAWMQGRNQHHMEQQRQRERAAELLGEVLQLLLDTAPDQLASDPEGGNATVAIVALTQRHEAARQKLYTLAVWYPSKNVRDLALKASSTVWDALSVSVRYLADLDKPGEGMGSEDAEKAWQSAKDVMADLMMAVRRS